MKIFVLRFSLDEMFLVHRTYITSHGYEIWIVTNNNSIDKQHGGYLA